MKRGVLLSFAFTLSFLASESLSEQIFVRSGAHEQFSRLVIRLPEVSDQWSVDQSEKVAILTVVEHTSGYDTSRVFDFINRDFVKSVESNNEKLTIYFNCDCEADFFLENDRFVVIDIYKKAENGVLDVSSFATQLVRQTEPLQFPSKFNRGAHLYDYSVTRRQEEIEIASNQASPVSDNNVVPIDIAEGITSAPIIAEGQSNAGEDTQLAEAQRNLSARVASAATQGLLEPSTNQMALPTSNLRPQIDVSIFDSSNQSERVRHSSIKSTSINLRVTSSTDLPIPEDTKTAQTTAFGEKCAPSKTANIENWGNVESAFEDLIELRSNLYLDTDRLNGNVAVSLAKLYLYNGFGAEAKQILSLDGIVLKDHPALVEMADIMEYGHALNAHFLPKYVDCDSPLALWAILAEPELDPVAPVNTNAALRALTGLPLHLRKFVAPALSESLLRYGDEAGAATALRSLERAPDPLTAAGEMARGDLQMSYGSVNQAQETYASVVSSNEQQSAEALIKFVDSHLEEDELIDESVATLVEAYALEMRDEPLGVELKRAHVLALAKSGQFDEAFETLNRIRFRGENATYEDLRSSLLDITARTAPDIVFLSQMFDQETITESVFQARVGMRISERLVSLGFSALAESVLGRTDGLPSSTRTKELRAEISLQLNRPNDAEASLYGVETDAALVLRAEAKRLREDHAEAAALYSSLENEAESLNSAWLAEDWGRIQTATNSPFSSVSSIVAADVGDSGVLDGMLERLNTAVEESAKARSELGSLIQSSN